jgi:hypothetical protein
VPSERLTATSTSPPVASTYVRTAPIRGAICRDARPIADWHDPTIVHHDFPYAWITSSMFSHFRAIYQI